MPSPQVLMYRVFPIPHSKIQNSAIIARMNGRRLILYLLLNAVVSATTTFAVLWLWDRSHRPAAAPTPLSAPTLTAASAGTPAVIPTFTSAPPTPTIYLVRSGDTLGTIAEQFGVSLEAILAANGLTDPNLLSVGQALIIPQPGAPAAATASAPPLATAPLLATATRDPNLPLPRLSIREARSLGQLADELLVIVNAGGPVDLAGWTLRDEAGHLYTFPALTLFDGGAVNLHTAAGEDTVIDLHWGLAEPLWAPGRSALLSDPAGNLHARFTLP